MLMPAANASPAPYSSGLGVGRRSPGQMEEGKREGGLDLGLQGGPNEFALEMGLQLHQDKYSSLGRI